MPAAATKPNFTTIKNCVRSKVREFCFDGSTLTDDEIGGTLIKDLNLDQNSKLPSNLSPYDGLAVTLTSCANANIKPLTGQQLKDNEDENVDYIARILYAKL